MIDTHAHLNMAPFEKDCAQVIERAKSVGVTTIIVVGFDLATSRKAVELADAYPEIMATVGFHPHEASKLKKIDIGHLAALTKNARVVAVGEIGLDFYRNKSPRETQLQVLQWLLELADEVDLPVVIHSRQADKDMTAVLRDWTASNKRLNERAAGVIHCFNGSIDVAQRYLEMGFYIAFGAYVGYPKSINLHHVIRSITGDRLLMETDCPYLPPQNHRGQRNEPSYILETLKVLAHIRKSSPEAVAGEATNNARTLFGLHAAE